MQYLISGQEVKPNRVETAEESKDKQYHVDYARWVISRGCGTLQQAYIAKYQLNRNFYMNRQWCVPEDLSPFFKDENNNDRNRLQVTRNYIQPMVEQYRGNADKMTFDHKVANLSPMAKSRREQSLAKLIAYNDVAKAIPEFGNYMKDNNFPTGKDAAEVESIFNNIYADRLVMDMNKLLRYSKNINKFDDYKMPIATDLALAGIGIMRPYPSAGEWMFERVDPENFGWDRSAKDPTLQDSSFFFEFKDAEVTSLFERYQGIPQEDRRNVEKFSCNLTGSSYATGAIFESGGKVPTYRSVWKDLTVDTFGYVMDEFGQRILHRINFIEPNEEKPKYTEKDLIPFKQLTNYQKRVLRGDIVASLYVDLWRFCDFIPKEILGSTSSSTISDVVLDFGIIPYQEPDLYKPTNMTPPYKVGTWSYMDGITLSPVDVVINPQRMINRFLSVMENSINNSGGAGVVFDLDLITDPEDVVRGRVNKGEGIGIHAKGRGVQNVFGRYDSTPKESIMAFSALIDSFKMGIEQVTGVNEGVKGDSNDPEQLVGVMQLMIQRGSIIQLPFYKAIADIFQGCYQSIISSGRRYYADNEVELIDAVGEDAANVIKLSKDTNTESLRVSLVRSLDSMNERVTVDASIMSWLQFGLIDQTVVSNLIGRATMEEALFELREYSKRLANQKRMASQQQMVAQQQAAAAQEQAGGVIYEENVRDKTRDQLNKQADRETKMNIAGIKATK
jgi:hypothetical protein